MENSNLCLAADPYSQCLAYLESDQILLAEQQVERIKDTSVRAIAEDQIRFVQQLKFHLRDGDTTRAKQLTRSLVEGVREKYEEIIRIHHVDTAPSTKSLRTKGKGSHARVMSSLQRSKLMNMPLDLRKAIEQPVQGNNIARSLVFSDAVMLQLALIARRAWLIRKNGRSKLRANITEIQITGILLGQRIERGGGRLSISMLADEVGVSHGFVGHGVRNLRLFLLKRSGWSIVGDNQSGWALEPDDDLVLPNLTSHDE
jgi:hypothetical protein